MKKLITLSIALFCAVVAAAPAPAANPAPVALSQRDLEYMLEAVKQKRDCTFDFSTGMWWCT
jgi:hypothetical protein